MDSPHTLLTKLFEVRDVPAPVPIMPITTSLLVSRSSSGSVLSLPSPLACLASATGARTYVRTLSRSAAAAAAPLLAGLGWTLLFAGCCCWLLVRAGATGAAGEAGPVGCALGYP